MRVARAVVGALAGPAALVVWGLAAFAQSELPPILPLVPAGPLSSRIVVPSDNVTVSGVTLVVVARPTRLVARCQNVGSGGVRLGSAAVTTTRGVLLATGAEFQYYGQAALYAVPAQADTTPVLACWEEVSPK